MPSSNANVSLGTLRTLHRIHRQLSDLRERLDRGPKQVGAAETHVKHREEEMARLRDELKTTRKDIDQKQLQLKGNEEKIKDLKRKLNMAASNREYQILKEQIAADEMANSVLEDEILEVLEQVDAFAAKIAEAEAALAAARQRAVQIQAEVQKQEPHIRHDIQRLEGELRQSEEGLPPKVCEVYRRMVRQRGEDALAVVIDGCCGGCNQQVPLNVQAEIRMAHPMFCKTCGRLLYLPEDAPPAQAFEK
ncbi:MAG: phospholipase [Thermoguttaceae bacterium]|jgi:predicted  nucleic acid-binding Zn-ribbon protein